MQVYFILANQTSLLQVQREFYIGVCFYVAVLVSSLLCLYDKINLTKKEPIRLLDLSHDYLVGGVVASWSVRSSPDRAVQVPALAGDIVLCS